MHNYNTKTYQRKNFKQPVKHALEALQFQQNSDEYLPNLRKIKRILRGSSSYIISFPATCKQLEVTPKHTHARAPVLLLQNMLLHFVNLGSVLIIMKSARDF
jgi:predicted Zn-ribbon and HTH transcriptional regulator